MFGRRKKLPPTSDRLVINFRDQRSALAEIRGIERFLSEHSRPGHRVAVHVRRGKQTLACSCGMGPGGVPVQSAPDVVPPVLREEDIDDDESGSAPMVEPTSGFTLAGPIRHNGLNVSPADPPLGRLRHQYGNGPFAKLIMPPLPDEPGLYLWALDGVVVYAGQTVTPLKKRLGSNGYATIATYNTLAAQPGMTNGGQQTNCRVNALANASLARGGDLQLWYRVTTVDDARPAEAAWMQQFGMPSWNRRLEPER